MVGFTIGGLILYSIATLCGAPAPIYVFPSLISAITPQMLPDIALAYGGHCVCSALCGVGAMGLNAALAKWSNSSPYACGWDHFVKECVPEHWVIVGLETGEAYAGILTHAEVSVEQKERDLILAEPALYDEVDQNYRSLPYSHIFLPATLIWSVAVVEKPGTDKQLVPSGESLFLKEEKLNVEARSPEADAA